MLGAAFPIVPLADTAEFTGSGVWPNGYLVRLRRIIPASIHGMPTDGWVQLVYRRINNNLRLVANGGYIENADGYDQVFANGSGTPLDYEMESWTEATGTVVARVRLTGFRAGVDYTLFHYFGKADVTESQANPVAAWDGFLRSNNMATGLDMSGNGRHFTLTGVGAATLLGSAAGDFG